MLIMQYRTLNVLAHVVLVVTMTKTLKPLSRANTRIYCDLLCKSFDSTGSGFEYFYY
jgi:hypothetical protein